MSAQLSAGASDAVDPETLATLRAMDGGDPSGLFDELGGLFLADLAGRLAAIADAATVAAAIGAEALRVRIRLEREILPAA